MINIHIDDKKTFTKKLFIDEDFDEMLLVEASVTTYATYNIDGRMQKAFYTNEEYEALEEKDFSKWEKIKPLCFSMIKGSKLPLRFKIVLKLSGKQTEKFLTTIENSGYVAGDICGLFLNIKYENNSMDVVTATSMKEFTLDKTVEESFDKEISRRFNAD